MLEPGGEADLAEEALGAEGGGELGVEDLEGDVAVVLEVLGEEDRGHAVAELALECITVSEAVAQDGDRVGHGAPPATSRWNLGFFRSGSKLGSTRSHPGET